MSDIYKFAAQNNLRFPSNRGQLTVEQLFQMPLQSKTGLDLDSTAKAINQALKDLGEESFVENAASNPQRRLIEISFEIVKDVIKTKQDENKAQLAKANKTLERKKLLDALGAKKDEALSKATIEELEKKLAELEVE